jgi:hypothetical protein
MSHRHSAAPVCRCSTTSVAAQTGLTSPTSGSSLHRNFETNQAEIHVQKVRDNWVGQPGKVTLDYDEATGRYSEPVQRPVVAARGYRDD